jgi:ABC-type Co2+ transport system permease subunit
MIHLRDTGITKTLFQIWIQASASPAFTWHILRLSLASMGNSVNHIQAVAQTEIPLSGH